MSPPGTTHPDPADLLAFALGKLNGPAIDALSGHLESCAHCQAVIEVHPADSLLRVFHAAAGTPTNADTPTPLAAATSDAGSATDEAEPLPRELLDHPRYQLLKVIGKGGMGVVYLAEHRLMKRPVAIKVIHRTLVDDPAKVARFRQEMTASAQLDHPNIVLAFEAEQVGDWHLLVMEYVEGQSLAQVVQREGPLPVDRACAYVSQAAVGLQHAHEKGMIHRDLKPDNLMLTSAVGSRSSTSAWPGSPAKPAAPPA